MTRCRALGGGCKDIPRSSLPSAREERGSQGVWKGPSAGPPYDVVLPAPVDRGQFVAWSDGGQLIVSDASKQSGIGFK